MNGLTLLAMLALAIGIALAWRAGVVKGRREQPPGTRDGLRPAVSAPAPAAAAPAAPAPAAPTSPPIAAATALPDPAARPPASPPRAAPDRAPLDDECARLLRHAAAENAQLRRDLADAAAAEAGLAGLAEERRQLYGQLASARAETARYRALVIDLENNAPPPLLDGPSAPDDLKLIVGIGPVLERMLQQMGITSYRQIARWTERDVVDFDARLSEFPGRIRRDAWVTQARALHQSKYGEALPPRDR